MNDNRYPKWFRSFYGDSGKLTLRNLTDNINRYVLSGAAITAGVILNRKVGIIPHIAAVVLIIFGSIFIAINLLQTGALLVDSPITKRKWLFVASTIVFELVMLSLLIVSTTYLT